MNALPSHTFCPGDHCWNIAELSAIPVLFEDSPTAFNRIVLAMVGRIVEQLNWFANLVCELNHSVKKLGTDTTAFGSIVYLQLQEFRQSLLFEAQAIPPILQRIDDKITGFMRVAKAEIKFSTIFIDNATRNILLLTSHVMISCSWIASSLPTTRILPNLDRGFAIEAQSFDAAVVAFAIFGFDVVEDRIGFGEFF